MSVFCIGARKTAGVRFGQFSGLTCSLVFVVFAWGIHHGPAAGQETLESVRVAGATFTYARFASQSSSALYAVKSIGTVSLFAALVQNHQNGYREILSGVLSKFSYDRQALVVAVAYADAFDASYLQVYLLPAFHFGETSFNATAEWYQPLESTGKHQFYVNPALLLVSVRPWLAFGGSYVFGVETGISVTHRLGPVVEFRVPSAAITLEFLRHTAQPGSDVRIAFTMGY